MRTHRLLPLPGLLLVLTCHCGGLWSSDDSPADPPAPDGLTAQGFLDAYPQAFCARYGSCCERASQTLDQCLAEQRARMPAGPLPADTYIDQARATACLDGLRTWSGDHDLCMLVPDDQFAACRYVFAGDPWHRYPGESCEQDDQCLGQRHPRCATDENTGRRNCRDDRRAPGGDDNSLPPSPCRTDTGGVHAYVVSCEHLVLPTCSIERDRCTGTRGPGEPCGDVDECADPLTCRDSVCAPPLADGQACARAEECGYHSVCQKPEACDTVKCPGVCALVSPPVPSGAACSDVYPYVTCTEGTCVEGTCQAISPETSRACGRPWPPPGG